MFKITGTDGHDDETDQLCMECLRRAATSRSTVTVAYSNAAEARILDKYQLQEHVIKYPTLLI